MDKQGQEYQWLEWAKELQFIAQAGLTYTKDLFDKERFERIREISAEIMSLQSKLPLSEIKDLFCNETGFQTPKLDTRAAIFKDNKILLVEENDGTWSMPGGCFHPNIETVGSGYFSLDELPPLSVDKNSYQQIEMCFTARSEKNWQVEFD